MGLSSSNSFLAGSFSLRPDLVGELITAVDVVGNLELCVTEENNAPMVDNIANIPIGDKAPYPYSKL